MVYNVMFFSLDEISLFFFSCNVSVGGITLFFFSCRCVQDIGNRQGKSYKAHLMSHPVAFLSLDVGNALCMAHSFPLNYLHLQHSFSKLTKVAHFSLLISTALELSSSYNIEFLPTILTISNLTASLAGACR